MEVTFNLQYVTAWGQELYVVVGNDYDHAQLMSFNPGFMWSTTCSLPLPTSGVLSYHFQVRTWGQVSREETQQHAVCLPDAQLPLNLIDNWYDEDVKPRPNHEEILHLGYFDHRQGLATEVTPGCVHLIVSAPDMINANHSLAVVGNTGSLGMWNPTKAIAMRHNSRGVWTATIPIHAHEDNIEYKFIIIDNATGEVIEWENGINRWLELPSRTHTGINVVTGLRYRTRLRSLIGVATKAAILQLRSDNSAGCGDFADLTRLINWAHTTGQNAVLAANTFNAHIDSSQWGLSPHVQQAINDYALDAIYLHVPHIGTLTDKKLLATHQRTAIGLNHEKSIDYERVLAAKLAHARDLFEEQQESLVRSRAFRAFVNDNEFWLRPFAAFTLLSRVKKSSDCSHWAQYAHYDGEAVKRFLSHRPAERDFIYFVQYHLHKQLRAAVVHAAHKSVVIAFDVELGAPQLHNPQEIEQAITERSNRLVKIDLASWPALIGVKATTDVRNPYNRLWMSMEALTANTALKRRIAALLTTND